MEKLNFKNSRGQKLVGNLNDCGQDYIVIHCHGYGSSKDGETAVLLSEKLAHEKISTYCFDFSGFGESEGNEEEVTISAAIDDLKSAVNLIKKFGFRKIALSGSSFGGQVAMHFTAENPKICLLGLKAPVSHYLATTTKVTKSKKFLDDAQKYLIYPKAKNILCPVLIIHGNQDEIVPLKQSQRTCQLIPHCHLRIIKDANHNFDFHHQEVIDLLVDWFVEFK